ncbi:unnamed protein product [Mytilus coruscus]|uniref:Ig-like domain-containing protein n=1 Tax=Mytilus coruscus TaxID=42192 RepID=A0A6J8ETY4_MYTCO|nr:unnamed protein product [Mytilus coruscus]
MFKHSLLIAGFMCWYFPAVLATQRMYVKSGSVANLSCPYETQDVSIKWRGPKNLTIYSINNNVNVQIDVSSRLKVNVESITGTYNLLVLNFTSADTGLYRCDTILNKHSVQHEIVVNVAEAPKHMEIINETSTGKIIGTQDFPVNLICTVDSGVPLNTLEWKNENRSIVGNYSDIVSYSFIATRDQHLKNFTCTANNSFYLVEKKIQLFIYLSPIVKLYVEPSFEIEEGKDVALTCEFESNNDLVELRWIKDNNSLSVSQNNHLLLTNVSKDDEGIYFCEVENQVAINSDQTEIKILYKPRLTDPFKIFEIESSIGQRSYISLNISSATRPYISWTYDPGPVGKLGYWNIQEIGEENYQLCSTIVPYDHSHFRTYGVRVRNSVGILNINVVLVGFTVKVFPTKLVRNLSDEIELNCNVSKNNLNASHMWIHSFSGVEIRILHGKVHDGMSTLHIPFSDYKDAGTYTCKWTSSMETHYSSSHIYVKSHPVLTSLHTFEKNGKTTLEVSFYSFPKPTAVLWFYRDKLITKLQLDNEGHVKEAPVQLFVYNRSVIATGYVTWHQVNETINPVINFFSCQIRNYMGNMDVSFHEYNNTNNTTTINSIDDENKKSLKYYLVGTFLTTVIVIIALGIYKHFYRPSVATNAQNENQREQEEVSRNSSQSSNNHSYDEVDSVYYHSVEWRNYNFEPPASAINDTHVNADYSIGSNDSEKVGDDPDQTRNDIARNSYMELV